MNLRFQSFLYGSSREANQDSLRVRLKWLVRWQWSILVLQLLCLPALFLYFSWPMDQLTALVLSLSTIVAANIFCYSAQKAKKLSVIFLLIPLLADLFQIGFVFHLMQVEARPLYPLLFVYVLVAATMLQGKSRPLFLIYLLVWIVLIFKPWIPTWNEKFSFISFLVVSLTLWTVLGFLLGMFEELEDRWLAAIDQQRRADRLQLMGAMASGFAHQFSTPLNTLKLRLNRLEKIEHVEESVDYQRAQESLLQCERSLADFIQQAWSTNHLGLEKIELRSWVEEQIGHWKKNYSSLAIDFVAKSEEMVELELPKDLFKLSIDNIVSNAATCTNLKIELSVQEKIVQLTFSDNGPGFPISVLERFGQPFITTKEVGTGLGLFNTYNLVKLLNGAMKIENKKMGGALVTIEFFREGYP